MLTIPDFVKITTDPVHVKWLREAYQFGSQHARDRSTKNGAVLLDARGNPISFGAGGLLPGLEETEDVMEAPKKYWAVRHAESSSVHYAARDGHATKGATLYVPWYSCNPCAHSVAESGISTIIGHEAMMLMTPDRWKDDIEFALETLHKRKVNMFLYRGKIGGVESLMNREIWHP